jgi:hypothetical protein
LGLIEIEPEPFEETSILANSEGKDGVIDSSSFEQAVKSIERPNKPHIK